MKQLTDVLTRTTEFDRTTVATPASDGTFDVELSPAWSSLIGSHGGYLTAIATRCAEAVVPDRHVRTITTSFLRRGRPGPATVRAVTVRHGKTITTLSVELEQDGHLATSSRVTMVAPVSGADWAAPTRIVLPPPSECVAIDPRSPVAHFDRAEGLLDPSSLPFTGGERAIVQGYIRPLEVRPVDAAWLAMASDWFPPPAFVRIDPPQGGISVDLTTHIHRTVDDHAGEWLAGRFEIEDSAGGLAVEHGRICTLDGDLLAESFHTRWIAES